MVSFSAKIDFMSKFLDSCRKKWHQFGRNKDRHKILHDISNKWTVNKTDQGTGQDIYCIVSPFLIQKGKGD
mgnify:CR=1 FL=1